MKNAQFLVNDFGEKIFAVIPIAEYLQAFPDRPSEPTCAVSDVTSIALPHSGGHQLDVVRLIDFMHQASKISIAAPVDNSHADGLSIPIDARREILEKVVDRYRTAGDHIIPGLDALIRLHFLPPDSPYRNTVQAVREVVDALVATGLFKRSIRPFADVFYRPVNALDYDDVAGYAYLRHHGAITEDGRSLVPHPVPRDFLP